MPRLDRRALLVATAALAVPRPAFAETKPGPFRNLAELDASLGAAGIGMAERGQLLALAKPCAALQSKAAPDTDIETGASKIGGAPDLPTAMAWPARGPSREGADDVKILRRLAREAKDARSRRHFEGEIARKEPLANREAPLAFMLQVDLASCAAAGELDPDIPREGRLLAFYDLVFKPWAAPRDRDFQLFHLTNGPQELARRDPPDLGEPLFGEEEPYRPYRNQLPPARLTPVFTYTLPDTSSMPFLLYPDAVPAPHKTWLEPAPTHLDASNRLGGWPENIQGDMAIELAAEEHGIKLPYGGGFRAAARRIQHLAEQWVMLLQIGDYDNTINDFDGLYYVWIKRDHLRARDFTKARIVYQTT